MTFELHLGDCLDPVTGLASLADDSIGVAILDPPYSEHVHSKSRRGLTVTHVGGADDEISERRELGFASITDGDMEAVAQQCARLVRRWILIFCDVESVHLWRNALERTGLQYLRTCGTEQPSTVIWHKLGGAPQFTGDRPAVAFEAIVVAHRPGKKRWNGGGRAGWYSVPTAMDRDRSGLDTRVHTTQKPVALMEQLVLDFSEPGEVIVDPFAGSGTTGVAAIRLGREFVGWEREAPMFDTAQARLRSTRALPIGYHGARAQGSLL